jgi:hypothetical protein
MIPTNFHRNHSARHRAAFALLVTALIVAAVAFSSGRVSGQGPDQQRRDLERVFSRHERLSLDPGQITRQVKQTRSLTLTTSRGTFEMTLEPHDMRAPGYVAEAWGDNGVTILERGPVRTYKGTVRGLPAAQARMTIDEETVAGLIITAGELFFLEPTKRYSGTAAKNDFVFYSASDLKESAGECGNTMAQVVAQHSANVSNQTSAKGPQPEAVFGPELEIALAAEADFEYFTALGSQAAAETQILTIMNDVEAIYSSQLGLQFSFSVSNLRVWTTASDPYTTPVAPATTIDAIAALEEFQDTYNLSPPAGAAGRDTAHLFTGRNIASNNNTSPSTIGIAFQPGLECPFDATTGFGYGMSENIGGNRAGLTAHEIGHNLSASHVTSANGSDCTTSIMNPSLNAGPNNFCQFSRDEITRHSIQVRDCLMPPPSGCTYLLSESTQNLGSGAGGSSVTVTTQAGCNWAVAEGEGWLTVTSGASGTGSGTVNYSVTANNVCGPRTGLVSIGDKIFTVQQAGNPTYLTDPSTATAIAPGQPLNGDLSLADCPTGLDDDSGIRRNAFMDRYKFNGMAGQKIRIEMNAAIPAQSGGLDTFLYLFGPDGSLTPVAENDDIELGVQTNSRIPCNSNPCNVPELLTLTQTGTYIIVATSFASGDSGEYSLTLTSEPLLLTAQVTDSVGSAGALNSVTFVRTSNPDSIPPNTAFRIFDPFNFSSDQTTRLILFTSDLGLPSQLNPDPNVLQVRAGGNPLVVENVGPFAFPPNLNGSYVVVALKRIDGQPMPTGSLTFTVTCRNLQSNDTTLTIAP